MEKLKSISYKIIITLLIIFLLISSFTSIFYIYNAKNKLNPIILILGTIILILFFISIYKFIKNKNDKTINITTFVLCFVFFILLSLFGSHYLTNPNTDLNNIQSALFYMLDNKKIISSIDYFSIYSAQTPLAILLYYVYKLGSILGFSNLKLFATIFNAFAISITALFTYLSTKKMSNAKIGFITLLFFIINPIWYFYCPYFYTDTLCIPFAAIGMYLFLCAEDSKKSINKILSLIFSGFFIALGTKVRVVVAFLLIAMLLNIFLKNKSFKNIIKEVLIIILGFGLGICSYMLIEKPFDIKVNKDLEFPISHWVMMSFNKDAKGKYNRTDYDFTKFAGNYDEKKDANIKEIKSRIKELGFAGNIKLTIDKISVNWSNGDYQYPHRLKNVEYTPASYEYIVGNNTIFINYFYQICKVTILISVLIITLYELKNSSYQISFIYIALFGSFLFYLIWEVKERYSLSFLPWMILLFGILISKLESLDSIKQTALKVKDIRLNINFAKIKTILSSIILLLTIITLSLSFKYYVLDKQSYNDTVITQYSYRNNVTDSIYNKTITQSFIANKPFNKIKLKFTKTSDEETHYNFALKDNNNKIIHEKEFSSNDVKNDSWYSFKFTKENIKENTRYYFSISSKDAKENNSLGLMSYNYEGYDIYPNGHLYENNTEIKNTALTFKVENNNKRAYAPIWLYIVICFILIGTEIIAFIPHTKRNRN